MCQFTNKIVIDKYLWWRDDLHILTSSRPSHMTAILPIGKHNKFHSSRGVLTFGDERVILSYKACDST